jgi:hypothetical protein
MIRRSHIGPQFNRAIKELKFEGDPELGGAQGFEFAWIVVASSTQEITLIKNGMRACGINTFERRV